MIATTLKYVEVDSLYILLHMKANSSGCIDMIMQAADITSLLTPFLQDLRHQYASFLLFCKSFEDES